MQKPQILTQIEDILGIELHKAPLYPDWITGLMVRKKGQAKYALEEGQLIGLNLAGVELTDTKWEKIEEVIDSKDLRALNLSSNNLSSITIEDSYSSLVHLEIADNKSLIKVVLGKGLANLERLVLRDNSLEKINLPYGLNALKYLDISRNQIVKIDFNGLMPQLFFIDASRNQLKNIDVKCLDNLPELAYWYLYYKPLNQSLIVHHKESHGANYVPAFKQLRAEFGDEEGVDNDEYKVIIVGDGTAGKTCIVNRLMYDAYKEDESTHGINIQKFTNAQGVYNFSYVLNLWDFGGQDIYHATHRLFLQSDAIYLLAWNKKTEEEVSSKARSGKKWKKYKNRKLSYWMRYIHAYGKNSPVLVIQTSKEKYPNYLHPDSGLLMDQYTSKLDYFQFVAVDSKPDDIEENGYEDMMSYLSIGIKRLKRKEKLPPQWVAVKNYLEEKIPLSQYHSKGKFLEADDATLDYETYEKEAFRLGVQEPKILLTKWLVPIGKVFYRENYFKNKIILNQEWAIRAIYILFERNDDYGYYQEILDNEGRFTGKDLRVYWSGYGEKEQELFIDFMLACGMCYEIKQKDQESKLFEERVFIAPEMLSDKRPKDFGMREADWKNTNYLKLRYQYDFAYYNYFQQFLVKTQADAEESINFYRYGMLIRDGKAYALIEFNEENKCIDIQVTEGAKVLLDKIRNRFKDIHQEEIKTSVGVGNNGMIDLTKLDRLKGQLLATDRIETEEGVFVPAAQFEPFIQLNEKETFMEHLPKKEITTSPVSLGNIYFSYAWRNEDNPDIEGLVDSLYSALKKSGFTVIRDKEGCDYGAYIDDFMEALGRGDLVIVFFSNKYFKSKNCLTELYLISKNSGLDKVNFRDRILPVMVESVDFEYKTFGTLLNYWKEKKIEGVTFKKDHHSEIGVDTFKELDTMIKAIGEFSTLFTWVKNMNRGDMALYSKDDFAVIKEKIINRLSANPIFQSSLDLADKLANALASLQQQIVTEIKNSEGKILNKLNDAELQIQITLGELSTEIREVYNKIDDNQFSQDKLEELNAELIHKMETELSSLPEQFAKQWTKIQAESKEIVDIKSKLKWNITIIPGILQYETELSKSLAIFQWAKSYWSNFQLKGREKK